MCAAKSQMAASKKDFAENEEYDSDISNYVNSRLLEMKVD